MVSKKQTKKPPHAHIENILCESNHFVEIFHKNRNQSLNGLKEILSEEICSQFVTFDHLELQLKAL